MTTNAPNSKFLLATPVRRMMAAGKHRAIWVLLGVVLLALYGWIFGEDKESEYVTVAAVRGDIEKVVTAQGSIQPRNYVDVGAQVSGQLKKIHVGIGDHVVKGQLLAEIDAAVQQARVEASRAQLDAQQAQLSQAKSQLKLSQLQFNRQKNLRNVDATSEDEFQIAEASVASAQAQMRALMAQIKQTESSLKEDEASLSYTRIFAPMDGVIVTLVAREGTTLNANQTAPLLMRIADLSVVTVETDVSEADIPRLRIGMPVYFSPIGDTQSIWHSELRQILPTPEVLNNVVLYTALFDVENKSGRLMSNMTAQVFFVDESAKNVVLVPVSAILKKSSAKDRGARKAEGSGEETSITNNEAAHVDVEVPARKRVSRAQVKVLVDGDIALRDVEVGVTDRIHAEIIHGVNEGDLVVVEGAKAPTESGGNRTRRPGFF